MVCVSYVLFAVASAALHLELKRALANISTVHQPLKKTPDTVVIGNAQYYYYANIGLGTPAQQMQVQIDTGSSDLWVMDASNPYCRLDAGDPAYVNCSDHLVFNPARSPTYRSASQRFSIDYADSTFARGHMAQDTLQIGSAKIDNCPFALANRASSGQIVMGIGFKGDESIDPKYSNVPLLLQAKGIIHTNAYSLWLNNIHATSGSLLFGAVDHSKYQNQLGIVPIVAADGGKPDAMNIMLHALAIGARDTQPTTLVQCSLPVLLDSGTSFVYLPSSIAHAIASSLNMRMDNQLGMYVGAYPRHSNGYFEFNFSGVQIRAPLDLLVDPVDGDPSRFQLLVVPSDDGTNILGDAFLRSAYIVYDLDHYEVGLAQAKYNVQTQNLQEITNRVPGTQAPQYSQTRQSYVRTARHISVVDLLGTPKSRPRIIVDAERTVMPYASSIPQLATKTVTATEQITVHDTIYEPTIYLSLTTTTVTDAGSPPVVAPTEATAAAPAADLACPLVQVIESLSAAQAAALAAMNDRCTKSI